jgi:riboflavin-specific deaminase-like protein
MNLSLKKYSTRPKVILSAAMSLDGQIATQGGDGTLSNTEDWHRVHHLRSTCDAIMVGSGTINADDSKLTLNPKFFDKGKELNHPIRVVVSSRGEIPFDARVITYQPSVPTIIAVSSKCSADQKNQLTKLGCYVEICGSESRVNLEILLQRLKEKYNINSILLEGGSILNGEMLSKELIDEIQIAIAPVLGGKGKPIFEYPHPITEFSQSPFLKILDQNVIGDMIWMHLQVLYSPREVI